MRLCLDLSSRSHKDAAHFRKIYWLPVSERVESCIAPTVLNIRTGLYRTIIISMICLCPLHNRYNTKLQMVLDTPLRKTNTGTLALSFLGPKTWTKIGYSTSHML